MEHTSPWVRWFCIVEKEKKRLVPHNRCVEFRSALCESYSESIPPHHCANRFHLITVEGSDGEDGPVMEYLGWREENQTQNDDSPLVMVRLELTKQFRFGHAGHSCARD